MCGGGGAGWGPVWCVVVVVMVALAGSPAAPVCGYSASACQVLSENGIKFGYFDILTDEEVGCTQRRLVRPYVPAPVYVGRRVCVRVLLRVHACER